MRLALSASERDLLQTVFERGADGASHALSKWLGQEVKLTVSKVDLTELEQATELLGPAEALVVACTMGLTGALSGLILLVFEDRAGLALVDMLTHQPLGTTTSWGELEQSAVRETTNIVGCAYVSALAVHLPSITSKTTTFIDGSQAEGDLVPTPPTFTREFAGSLLQFALMEQAMELDQILLIHSQFAAANHRLNLNWTLLFTPSRASLQALAISLRQVDQSGLKRPEVV
jgi:chemotaxis protein CheC